MAVEWVIQGMGAALTQISTVDCSVSFWASTAAAWFVTELNYWCFVNLLVLEGQNSNERNDGSCGDDQEPLQRG